MEMFVGRVVASAKVNTLKDERQVVNFTIAVNENYRSRGSDELKKITRFIRCDYWIKPKIAEFLTKGSLVEVCGRIDVSVWKNMEGEAKGALTLHVSQIKLHGKTSATTVHEASAQPAEPAEVIDDLPF